ncbi:MAG: hypothetical protein WBA74_06150, partial [Cyclobacteriaceae bacterium]
MTLKEFKQELINYARTLIPDEYKDWVRVPGSAASQALYIVNTDKKLVTGFITSNFEEDSKSFQLARNDYYGCQILQSYQYPKSDHDREVSELFTHQSMDTFLAEEMARVKQNLHIGITHPESEINKLLISAETAGLIKTLMSNDKQQIWQDFLETWPVERVKKMQLEEYTNLKRNDSFCYWLEARTYELGSIWGGSSYKFGIYKRNNLNSTDSRSGYKTDGEYGWVGKFGDTRDEAFENVKDQIIQVVEAAKENRLQEVNTANLGASFKWKIAALYHESIPLIYKPRAINSLLDHFNLAADVSSDKYQLLSEEKGKNETIIELSERLWGIYAGVETASAEKEDTTDRDFPLNQIFYGPPGTGKTFHTLNEAVKIIENLSEPEFEERYYDRKELRTSYQKYIDNRQIAFTTFHQSMSYEDFV